MENIIIKGYCDIETIDTIYEIKSVKQVDQ